MCECDKRIACANGCFSVLLVFVLLLMIPYVFIPAGEYENYHQHACQIERIVYPTELPTPENTTGWARCDCGKHCMTYSPCIKIFTNVSDTVIALPEFYEINSECTFHDSSCPNGEDITTILGEQEAAHAKFLEYNNRTVECYYDDDISYIFLEKEWDWPLTIGFLVFVGVFTTILIVINTASYCEDRRKSLENKKKSTKGEVEMDYYGRPMESV